MTHDSEISLNIVDRGLRNVCLPLLSWNLLTQEWLYSLTWTPSSISLQFQYNFISTSIQLLFNFSSIQFTHLNAQFNFSSGQPLLVTSMARRNSLKSIEPFLSVSKVLENDVEKTDWWMVANTFPPENMITEFSSVSLRKTFWVDLHEALGVEFTIRTVRHEASVPFWVQMTETFTKNVFNWAW